MQQAELCYSNSSSSYAHHREFTIRKYNARGESATVISAQVQCDALEVEFADNPALEKFILIPILRITQTRFQTGLLLRQKGLSIYSRLGIVDINWYYASKKGRKDPWSDGRYQQEKSCLGDGEIRTITIM